MRMKIREVFGYCWLIFSSIISYLSFLSLISCIYCSKFVFFKKQITSIYSIFSIISNIWGNILLETFGMVAVPMCAIGISYYKNKDNLFLSYFLLSVPSICVILCQNGFDSVLGSALLNLIEPKYMRFIAPGILIIIWIIYLIESRGNLSVDISQSIKPDIKKKLFRPIKELINNPKQELELKQNPISMKLNQATIKKDNNSLPPLYLLQAPTPQGNIDKRESQLVQEKLSKVLKDFNINGELTGYSIGPVVTLHKLKLPSGIRASRVIGLSSDIARCIEAKSARISQIAGRDLLGIEVSNANRRTINISEIFASTNFQNNNLPLLIGLGVGIGGEPEVASLAKMPHLLISGTTGSGKSVCMHSIIMSLLYKNTADDCRMILIDPKMLELSVYNSIPHLMTPVITEYNMATPALRWAVREMDDRYRKIAEAGVRNLEEYNSICSEEDRLSYIVIVIDELADLISAIKGKEGKDFENYLQRLAQKARAAGIHLVVATQRPSVDVVSGVIKANFPTRITFQLASEVDRRVIGEKQSGAEHLIGNGDMLYISPGNPIKRLQGPYISNSEVEKVVSWLSQNCSKKEHILIENQASAASDYFEQDGDDPLYEEAIKIAKEGRASISNLQRRLKIGFPRAGRIYEKLLENGIIQKENNR